MAEGAFLGERVPMLGIGLAALGRPGYINLGHDADLGSGKSVDEMRDHCWQVLDAAWRLGIRCAAANRIPPRLPSA
jgi:aryl-alcohol dehydrogenase-like predicted oxidoreductase